MSQLPPLVDPYDKVGDLELKNSKALGTSDSANNSYADPKQVKICPEGKRIDHILYKVNPAWEVCVITSVCIVLVFLTHHPLTILLHKSVSYMTP